MSSSSTKNLSKLHKQANKCKTNNKVLAFQLYTKLIENNPYDADCLNDFTNFCMLSNLTEQAIEFYNKIVEKHPKHYFILNLLGACYLFMNNYFKAIDYFKKVLTIKNDIPEVYNSIGTCYFKMRDYRNSENCYKISVNLYNLKSFKNLADVYFYKKEYDKSIDNYTKYITFVEQEDIELLKVNYSLSFPYLAKNDFIKGFELYENRLKDNSPNTQTNEIQRVEIDFLEYWNGKDTCNNLLVIYEQGIGDNIQYYRFIIELSRKYPEMKITYFCKDIVSPIFKEYENISICKDLYYNVQYPFNYKVYIMSLPYLLQVNTIEPNKDQYILVNNNKYMYWKERFSHMNRPKIGFVFNGLLSSIIEKNISLCEIKKMYDLNIELICICRLNEVKHNEYFDELKERVHFFDIDNDVPFEDTIAILQNIDMLITVDTYIVHLAGVLGIKTFLLLGYTSDWRWSNKETNTYWYNSVELIRMKENKNMDNILVDVKTRILNEIERS